MFITLYYRLCSKGVFTLPLQWDVDIDGDMYDRFVNARGAHKDDYDRIMAECDDAEGRKKALIRLNYEIVESLFPEWCSDLKGKMGGACLDGRADVCIDGCMVSEGDADRRNVLVTLSYTVDFGKGDVSDEMHYDAMMTRDDYDVLVKHKSAVMMENEFLDLDDIAGVLPEWADRVYGEIVQLETDKFRKEPFYEIWGFNKDEIDAPDWEVTEIADIFVSVFSIGNNVSV